jgi:hypothetical protein
MFRATRYANTGEGNGSPYRKNLILGQGSLPLAVPLEQRTGQILTWSWLTRC